MVAAVRLSYSTVKELMYTASDAISVAMAVGSVTTVPSCRVIDVRRPPAPGVMAVTWMLSGSGWVTMTWFSVWPGAGVTVTVRVRL
ncbi:hypothetical protein D3C76_1253330 [compost metagenome]